MLCSLGPFKWILAAIREEKHVAATYRRSTLVRLLYRNPVHAINCVTLFHLAWEQLSIHNPSLCAAQPVTRCFLIDSNELFLGQPPAFIAERFL